MPILSLSWPQWATAGLAAVLVGLTKAGFGAGAGILVVPLMAVTLGAERMLPLLLPLLLCGDVFALVHYPRQIDRRNLLILVPGSVAGVALGWLLLAGIVQARPKAVGAMLDVLVRVICIVFVAIQVWRLFREAKREDRPGPYRPQAWQGAVVGVASGLTSTLSHAAGPLITLFLLPQKLETRVFVGTTVGYFFFANAIKLVPYSFQGLFTAPILGTSLVLMPAVVVGTWAGLALNRNVPGRAFILVVYGLTLASGIKLLL